LPLGFPAYNTIDSLDKQNAVRFGLRQRLQTRWEGKQRDLVELTGWTDWNIEQNDGQEDWNDFFGTIESRPWDWLAVGAFTRYDFQDETLRELNTAVRFMDTDRWSVGVGTRFLRDDSNLLTFGGACRLGTRWVVQGYERVDMKDGFWESHEYMLRQETHDWYISYGFRFEGQRRGDDEYTVFFSVTLKAYPGFNIGLGNLDL
jgi:hypothetical protein